MSYQNLIVDVAQHSSSFKVDWEHDLCFCTIVQVVTAPAFLVSDIMCYLAMVEVTIQDTVSLIIITCTRPARSGLPAAPARA
jgi:hypothetical protein